MTDYEVPAGSFRMQHHPGFVCVSDEWVHGLLNRVEELTCQRDDARRLALPAFTSPEGDLSEHTHALDKPWDHMCTWYDRPVMVRLPTGFMCSCGATQDDQPPIAQQVVDMLDPEAAQFAEAFTDQRPSAYDMPVGSVVVTAEQTYQKLDEYGFGYTSYSSSVIERLFSDGLVTEWRLP